MGCADTGLRLGGVHLGRRLHRHHQHARHVRRHGCSDAGLLRRLSLAARRVAQPCAVACIPGVSRRERSGAERDIFEDRKVEVLK